MFKLRVLAKQKRLTVQEAFETLAVGLENQRFFRI